MKNHGRIGSSIRSLLLVGLALSLSVPVLGQEQSADPMTLRPLPRSGDQVEWHTVTPGDTLEGITKRYLGNPALWRENYRLNPQLRDPNVLAPGQSIRIITSRPSEKREAVVTLVARNVESRRFPNQVEPTQVGDRLREQDGVRTYVASSAELALDDASRLAIGENSLVYLQRVDATLKGVQREAIEIRNGQAELAAQVAPSDQREIEIFVGGTRAVPSPGADGASRTRARKSDTGGAAVMAYGGSSQVEAAGASVAVAQGMGTTVPEDGPPNPPERLLEAPVLNAPAVAERFGYSNPPFQWSPVDGAAGYTIEVCEDAQCSGLVARAADLEALRWFAEPLPVGTLYWRVTAVSLSGLDGFPSEPQPFIIENALADLEPPTVVAVLTGPGQVVNGAVSLAAGGALRLESHDDASGVAGVEYRWSGGDWQPWTGDALVPASPEATLEVRASDLRYREAEPWSLPVRAGG
jgi:LysM repeat protein